MVVIMNLLAFLKDNEFSRKIFGKRELKIIEKQLNGISLTQSEKNRLSRDIRPKFKFIKECSIFKNEFELKKGFISKKIIEEAKKIILNDILSKNIKSVLLYGSIVENKMTMKSDLDLAVVFDKIDLKEATLFRKRVLSKTNSKIDVQVFNILPSKIKKEILRRNKVLYEVKL
jgi:predicted nucleotidyltransferase